MAARVDVVVREHGELWLHALEYLAGFHAVRMMLRDDPGPARASPASWDQLAWRAIEGRILFPPAEFVDQHINTLRELDKVVRGLRVSGQDDGAAPVVNPVPKRGLTGAWSTRNAVTCTPLAA